MPANPWVRVVGLLALVVLGLAMLAFARSRDDSGPGPRYVAIADVPRQPAPPAAGPDASTGSFTSRCGVNENGHRNSDNLIVSPGEPGGAHHLHDYVGNVSTDAFSTDASLAAAGTTCSNGDRSTYYWPVLRLAAGGDGGDHDHGTLLHAQSVTIRFHGNPTSPVVPMPRFLRASAGDAKAATADHPAALARWSCTGAEDRQTPLYPVCPRGQLVVRTFDFPSCWDGRRTDSPDHRAHIVFPAADGSCPHNTFPVPRLRLRVTYAVPAGEEYVVDTRPEQHGSSETDHGDFVDVMPPALMDRAVACINSGRDC